METELEIVVANIIECAKENNYEVGENVMRIARAKIKFFGVDNWKKCPCYPPNDTEHGCGTKACAEQIENDGVCHCSLYRRK